MTVEYKTTTGVIEWSAYGYDVEKVPDPEPPDADPRWELKGSCVTEMRRSRQAVLWFWCRHLKEESDET